MKDKTIEKIKKDGINSYIETHRFAKHKVKHLMKKYATAYYSGQALIEDEDFEYLIQTLKVLDKDDEYLQKSGWGYKLKNGKKHIYGKVGTLNYYFDFKKIEETFKDDKKIVIMPKFDGINFALYYKDGNLLYCLTRGDGYKGKDITKKYKNHLLKIPKEFEKSDFGIVGEIILEKDASVKIKPRDYVAKIINSHFLDNEKLSFMPFGFLYNPLQDKPDYLSQLETLDKFLDSKIERISFDFLPNFATMEKIYKNYQTRYFIDGLVISNLDKSKQVALKFAKDC